MSTPNAIPDPSFHDRGVMFWLPPGGFGNNIGASAWAILADLPEHQLSAVLFALADARIAGYVAPIRSARLPRHTQPDIYRLWVDSLHYHHTEDILMELLRSHRDTRPTGTDDKES